MKRYFVTGGSGFIGSALVKRLLQAGHAVVVLDDHSRGRSERLADVPGDLRVVQGDVRDGATVAKAAQGADVCLHLAAGHLVLSEWLSPAHGLELGLDYIEITGPGSLYHAAEMLGRFPGLWHRVRVRGRLKAEQFRASRVWPRLLHDAIADVGAFGSVRP